MSAGFSTGTGGGGEAGPISSAGNFKDGLDTDAMAVTSESKTIAINVGERRRRLKTGLVVGLGLIGVGTVLALAEPGPLDNVAITVDTGFEQEPIATISEGDRLGLVTVIAGSGLALSASIGLAETKKRPEA